MCLENDDGTAPLGPLTPGPSSFPYNSQCTSGNNITVVYALSLSTTFKGLQNIYLLTGSEDNTAGWVQMGTWTP